MCTGLYMARSHLPLIFLKNLFACDPEAGCCISKVHLWILEILEILWCPKLSQLFYQKNHPCSSKDSRDPKTKKKLKFTLRSLESLGLQGLFFWYYRWESLGHHRISNPPSIAQKVLYELSLIQWAEELFGSLLAKKSSCNTFWAIDVGFEIPWCPTVFH